MQKLGYSPGHMNALFNRFEEEGDWKVSPDKLVEGILRIKNSTKGMGKVLAFLTDVFEQADNDGNGELDRNEFDLAFSNEEVKNGLLRIGIDPDDVTSLFPEIDKDKSGAISLDEFVQGFIELRNPIKAHDNLLQTIERFFIEYSEFLGDRLDEQSRKTITISRAKFRNFWQKDNVQRKMRKFKDLPDSDRLYSMMVDEKKSRAITVETMLSGLSTVLKNFAAR